MRHGTSEIRRQDGELNLRRVMLYDDRRGRWGSRKNTGWSPAPSLALCRPGHPLGNCKEYRSSEVVADLSMRSVRVMEEVSTAPRERSSLLHSEVSANDG
jgi:hypothetical protein